MAKQRESARADQLGRYRAKRSVERTAEPFGPPSGHRPRLFVVQKHAARSMHFDLRLELGGVLLSWAVPKGPSLDPQDKRLAMQVEEHPVEYADFEGVIPPGNYGAGAVIVWDRGLWLPAEDPQEGLETGKLLFDLLGHKLRGRWTLFRLKGRSAEWLLVKKPDGYADPKRQPGEESILSGLTVEQLRDGADPAGELRAELERLGAPRREVRASGVEPMLATSRGEPFSKPGWLFELKHDGYRLIAAKSGGRPFLRYRRGEDVTGSFPEIAGAVRALPYEGLVLDGELVALDPQGRSSFQRLQGRVQLKRRADIERATIEQPVTLFTFDLLACEGFDLRPLPLAERKRILARVLPPVGALRYSEHFEREGERMFEEVARLGGEGIVGKKADSPYRAGRSPDWLKIRVDRTADFAVVGFSLPAAGRAGFGALHLAVCEGAGLVYAGRAGSGFSDAQLREIRSRLDRDRRSGPACTGPLPKGPEHVWVEPRLVCEVRYKEWTDEGLLRQPVFLRLREDKPIEDCIRPDERRAAVEPPAAELGPDQKTIHFTNLDKVFWPDEGYTKGDLIEYYRSISRWILPYLEGRPVVLTRYPDGIKGKSFFQKDAPGFVPEWIRTETMWSEHAQRELRYFVCEDEESLLYLANLGTIPLHLWSSRVDSLQQPDWCILDLDPKEAPFQHVVQLARAIQQLCKEIGLDCFVKTSGSTGLHVLLPLGRQCTYEQSRSLGELLARVIVADLPDIATIERSVPARHGRVYLDYLQNGHGRLLVAPFSVRPLPGAPVSTPLRWSEVNGRLEIASLNLRAVPTRQRRMRQDPMQPLLQLAPDLGSVLELLGRRLGRIGGTGG